MALAATFVGLELLTSLHPDYGYFLDELYYIACAKRPELGYVDHPPLASWLLMLNRALLGDSLLALRLVPALCGAATLVLSARVAWRLGGDAAAQLLAALAVMMAPVLIFVFSVYTTNAFDVLFWTLALSVLVEVAHSENAKLWPLLGLCLGLGIMSKHTSVLLAAAMALAVVISPMRRRLAERPLWFGVLLAGVIVIPNLWWQVAHDWASWEFYAATDREANVPTSLLAVLDNQFGSFNPAALPIWVAGLYFFIQSPRGKPYRVIGWVMAILFAALLLGGRSRPDRIMGVYPVLFAAGAVQLATVTARRGFGWLRIGVPIAMAMIVALTIWLAMPVVSPETVARYTKMLGEGNDIQREVGTSLLLLPLAHRMGSRELAADVERVVAELDPALREQAIILAESYSPAGALELLGASDLPPVYSPHNSYYLWGPPATEPNLVIAVGFEPDQLAPYFADIQVVARSECKYCMGWRQDVPIAVARGARKSLREAWPELRRYGYGVRKLYLLQKSGAL